MPRPALDLYLAPHFDDAVLSCGASIHRRARAGRRQVVLTVCAGPPEGALTSFAAEHHRRWGASPGGEGAAAAAMVARRRGEDDAALAVVGAEAVRLAVPDAIYRRRSDGRAPYDDLAALFGPIDPGEGALVGALAASLDDVATALGAGSGAGARVWIPLAIGGHVDHRLTRAAAEAWLGHGRADAPEPAYYEDLPYATAASAAEIAALTAGLARRAAPVGPEDLAAKTAAVACYASQLSTFWPSAAAMAADVRAWAVAAAGSARAPMPAPDGTVYLGGAAPGVEAGWHPARPRLRAARRAGARAASDALPGGDAR